MTPAELRAGLSGVSVLSVALELDRRQGRLLATLVSSPGIRIRPEVGDVAVRYTLIPSGMIP